MKLIGLPGTPGEESVIVYCLAPQSPGIRVAYSMATVEALKDCQVTVVSFNEMISRLVIKLGSAIVDPGQGSVTVAFNFRTVLGRSCCGFASAVSVKGVNWLIKLKSSVQNSI